MWLSVNRSRSAKLIIGDQCNLSTNPVILSFYFFSSFKIHLEKHNFKEQIFYDQV